MLGARWASAYSPPRLPAQVDGVGPLKTPPGFRPALGARKIGCLLPPRFLVSGETESEHGAGLALTPAPPAPPMPVALPPVLPSRTSGWTRPAALPPQTGPQRPRYLDAWRRGRGLRALEAALHWLHQVQPLAGSQNTSSASRKPTLGHDATARWRRYGCLRPSFPVRGGFPCPWLEAFGKRLEEKCRGKLMQTISLSVACPWNIISSFPLRREPQSWVGCVCDAFFSGAAQDNPSFCNS